MPTELRSLVFGEAELKEAAIEHCNAACIPVPDSPVEALSIGTDPTEALSLRFREPGEAPCEVKLTSYDLLEALIEYCRATHIPIPQAGVRSLTTDPAGIRLTIRPNEAQRAA